MSNADLSKLHKRYTGEGASRYEKNRASGERWQREHEVTRAYLSRHTGKSVLDCPVGTGRFLPLYAAGAMSVVASDRSADMLTETRNRALSLGLENVSIVKADATAEGAELPECQVVVCVRFLNWLPADVATPTFARLASRCTEEMIISLTTIDERKFSGSQLSAVRRRLEKSHDPKDGSDLPPNGPHSHDRFRSWLENTGMEVAERDVVAKGKGELEVAMYRLVKARA